LLNKYLGLAPAGDHAAEARELLEKLDDPISATATPRR
jgi:hypothetical protein